MATDALFIEAVDKTAMLKVAPGGTFIR